MKTVKFTQNDKSAKLIAAVATFHTQKEIHKTAEKALDAAKIVIERELKALRGIELGKLDEGETVFVEIENHKGLKIDRTGQDRVDVESLRAVDPDTAAKFQKHTTSSRFTALA